MIPYHCTKFVEVIGSYRGGALGKDPFRHQVAMTSVKLPTFSWPSSNLALSLTSSQCEEYKERSNCDADPVVISWFINLMEEV
jgi:hypothetical protein